MCGIAGWSWVGSKTPEVADFAVLTSALAIMNDSRGGDSWGVASPDIVEKGLGRFQSTEMSRHLVKFPHAIIHTRYATVGGKSKENAHPFIIGAVVGSHNGAVWNHEEMNKKYDRDFKVDSMHLFAHINEQLPLNELEGYGAIQYFDRRFENTIFLCRMLRGELAVGVIPKVGVVWSSKMEHLKAALTMAGLSKDTQFWTPKEEKVYAIKDGRIGKAGVSIQLSERKATTTKRSACDADLSSFYGGETWIGYDPDEGRAYSRGRSWRGEVRRSESKEKRSHETGKEAKDLTTYSKGAYGRVIMTKYALLLKDPFAAHPGMVIPEPPRRRVDE